MADGWWQISAATAMHDARALIYRLGPGNFFDRVLLAWSRSWSAGVADDRWHDLVLLPDRWTAPVFPLKAADFIARGIAEGPALGQVLRLAEDAWLAADFPLDGPALKAIADQTVARFTRDNRP